MIICEAISEFILNCRANGLSPTTIKWYRSILNSFANQFGAMQVDEVDASQIRTYIVWQRSRLSANSVKDHVTALHAFWRWVSVEYDIANPMRTIKRPARQNPQVRAIEVDDLIRLLSQIKDDDYGIRDRAIVSFLADTGARLSGIVSLTKDNLYISEGFAIVTEKGSKARKVIFTHFTASLLYKWLYVRRSESDAVFINIKTGRPLTASGIEQILKRMKRRAGIKGRVNPHSFRHNFAREYLLNGGDIVTLARLLGHNNIQTTAAYYAVFSESELKDLHEKYSPLKRVLKMRE
jgi:site-specific recombinase XerD